MTAAEIAETLINGNWSAAREALLKKKGKTIVLDVLVELAYEHTGGYPTAIRDLRTCLKGR